jgi:hypothetical protein
VGRVTRTPPKPKIKYEHEVAVGKDEFDQAWIWEDAARIGGLTGYKVRPSGWAARRVQFDTREKAAQLDRRLRRWRHEEERRRARLHPCPVGTRYREAAVRQHGVIWGLSTGHIRPIVQAYRRARMDCSTHESPYWDATQVMVARGPGFDFERSRLMVDAMLLYIEARHRDWFWRGLQGDRRIAGFLRY